MHASASLLVFAAAIPCILAHPASILNVAIAKKAFTNAQLVPQIFPTFDPIATLFLNFSSSVGIASVGQALPLAAVSVQPSIIIKGTAAAEATAGGPFNVTTAKYTVLITDAAVVGNTNSTALVRHYLQNDMSYGPNHDHSVLLVNTTEPITAYAAPNPPSGSGPHRYVALAFLQPASFTPPADLSVPGTGVGRFDPNEYIASTGLTLLCANYFTVEVGNATASIAATFPVDTTALPEYTPTTAIGTSTTSTGTISSIVSTTTTGAASKTHALSVFLVLAAAAAGAALA